MAELLNRYARVHEVVPVESWKKDGIDGWLFRKRDNNLVFITSTELLGHQPVGN